MRFLRVDFGLHLCVPHHFQFSLWDSEDGHKRMDKKKKELSILFMRFIGRTIGEVTIPMSIFQFSLWDSGLWRSLSVKIHSPFNSLYEILVLRICERCLRILTFNSLYEIRVPTPPLTWRLPALSILFMRFTLSILIYVLKLLMSFNSLYEIPRTFGIRLPWRTSRLSILFMRFRGVLYVFGA